MPEFLRHLQDIARDNLLQAGLFLLGLFLILIGLVQIVMSSKNSAQEVVVTQDTSVELTPVVDVAGAVEKPGVYRLDSDARISDALIAAGGLAALADRVWVAKFLNQADFVTDGQKLYIPVEGENQASADISSSDTATSGHVAGDSSVNVNTASLDALKSLKGIGDVRASAIIAARPYASLEDLKTKAGLTQKILDDNQGRIVLY